MEHMYELEDTNTIISPSFIYYEEIIRENIKRVIRAAGSPGRLRPHAKSHESKDVVWIQMKHGITKFKTATVTEAKVAAGVGVERIILACPLTGPNMERLAKPVKAHPDTVFYGVEDDPAQFGALSGARVGHNAVLPMLVDIDMGMSRIGVPIERLEELYRSASSPLGLHLYGMYCYNGNHNNKSAAVRQAQVDDADKKVSGIMGHLNGNGTCCELAVAGDTPSFSCYTGATRRYLPPDTVFIIDTGYYMNSPDLDFIPGIAVMTKVISHLAKDVLTTDLDYKVIASSPVGQRGHIIGLEDAVPIIYNEEHWVFRLEDESKIPAIGSRLYVIPTHVCPVTALYPGVLAAKEGQVTDR